MRSTKPITLLLVLGTLPVIAFPASPDEFTRGIACWAEPLSPDPEADASSDPDFDRIVLSTGSADIERDGMANFGGPIEIRNRARSLQADSASYDSVSGRFSASGNIEYQDAQNRVSGGTAAFDTGSRLFSFSGAEFELSQTPARGSAREILFQENGKATLTSVRYTSCPPGNEDWMLRADKIELDTERGMGTARGASIRFKDVPFVYLPYFTYPITDRRKSGLLFPRFVSSDKRGLELSQPVYWNIAPNYDATFVPRLMSKRGLQMGAETRFKASRHDLELWGDYLGDDDRAGFDRWRLDLATRSMLPRGWRGSINATAVSDDNYFEDLSASQRQTSLTNISRTGLLEYYDPVWSLNLRVQDFQTIDPLILPVDEPYTQLPQLAATGVWREGWLGMDYGLVSEATYFDRDDSVTGARVHVKPSLSLPLRRGGLYFIPELALDHTFYRLQDEAPGTDSMPNRTAPIARLDLGAVFERATGRANEWMVTLEPRALYIYVPYRDQSEFPVFDTIRPDFNLVQLYRGNRFVGYDRLADVNQLSLGVTARFLEASDGREVLTATLGHARYFDSTRVLLPGEALDEQDSSDYIAEVSVDIWRNWGVDANYQLDTDTSDTEKAAIRLRYRPGDGKAINLAYRYAQDTLEQTDLSFSWPVATNWNVIGRYNYSLIEQESLDRFLGVEYGSCCWAVSVVARRAVSRSTGQSDSAVSLQFILKGFSNLGSNSVIDLRRDILGERRF